ncbi:MAG: hypothetical protein JW715_15265 [Sedimentisphaerales bacterium]|nr:hypothetical protein [Sedimentisphaerales bacterium]
MSVNCTNIVSDDRMLLAGKLQELLQKQIELVQKGRSAGKRIEELLLQTQILVDEIGLSGILDSEQFKKQKEQIRNLYAHLYMAISAQKDETSRQLSRVRKGKNTINTYRKNI